MYSSTKALFSFIAVMFLSLIINGKVLAQTDTASVWKKNNTNIYYNDGNVGIGTQNPDKKLTVDGTIHTEEVIIDLSVPQPDYVFEEDYNLSTLEEVEAFIKTNKHLPGIPSAKDVKQSGLNAGEMHTKLLEKVEELTLYVIELEKENKRLAAEMIKLKVISDTAK
jgi:hypothetical protein